MGALVPVTRQGQVPANDQAPAWNPGRLKERVNQAGAVATTAVAAALQRPLAAAVTCCTGASESTANATATLSLKGAKALADKGIDKSTDTCLDNPESCCSRLAQRHLQQNPQQNQ